MKRLNALTAVLCLFFVSLTCPASPQLKPFFAPPEASGRIVVRLCPMEKVVPGEPQLVTFGFPFPRGPITADDLLKVRVLKGSEEIPAYVRQLTPWRHVSNPSVDGRSVRIARIQIHYTFTVTYPHFERVMIEWGTTNRTRDVATMEKVRRGWHLVTSGTFTTKDNVCEPNVYTALSKRLLAKGLFKPLPMKPFHRSIAQRRDDPYQIAAVEHWPYSLEQEHAAKNNFYTIINKDDRRVMPGERCDYRNRIGDTNGEPWLHDPSSAMFMLYSRSGFLKPLREAVRLSWNMTLRPWWRDDCRLSLVLDNDAIEIAANER